MKFTESPVYVAINMSHVVNSPESFRSMREIGPKVCVLTASSPGFLGFQAQYQIGVHPFAGRYGGAELNMLERLNPIRNYQYTVWESAEAHTAFHREHFARVFELCVACFDMVVEGPWEPVYSVIAGNMPLSAGAGRVVALGEHDVKPGEEETFEQGAFETMEAISDSPGFLGYMIMKEIGVNPWGSFMLDPQSMMEMLETLGANPPADPRPLFAPSQAAPTPARYLVHSEWETAEMAQIGLGKVLVNWKIRQIHNARVMPHLIRGPYIVLFRPMFEDASWRRWLAPARGGEGSAA
jgi:sulfur oxygenase/reductase